MWIPNFDIENPTDDGSRMECEPFGFEWCTFMRQLVDTWKFPVMHFGVVLPPWFLLSWLRWIPMCQKTKVESLDNCSNDNRQCSATTDFKSTKSAEAPLDLRMNSLVRHTLEDTKYLMPPVVPVTCFGCFGHSSDVTPDQRTPQTRLTCGRKHESGDAASFVNCPTKSLPSTLARRPKLAHGKTGSGPGKQPVTRCYQCKKLFPTLLELNAHFVLEHACVLRTELQHTKSWRSHALESLCVTTESETAATSGPANSPGYPCPYCDYFAKWPTELQKHIMVHSKERPHRCVVCGLSYKWKWDLGRHFDKSHHKAMNPYKKNGFFGKAHHVPCKMDTDSIEGRNLKQSTQPLGAQPPHELFTANGCWFSFSSTGSVPIKQILTQQTLNVDGSNTACGNTVATKSKEYFFLAPSTDQRSGHRFHST
ncbi:unnamed protein product [Dicrocoelium dendriticum]|nr:unnamed protein product [Dicrocoelium dendriticum]